MPYIKHDDRAKFQLVESELTQAVALHSLSNGELNYLITKLALAYLARHGISYNTISDVVKAMECAKLEFYRRVVVPYEDEKRILNGEV